MTFDPKTSRVSRAQPFTAAGFARIGSLRALELSTALQLAAVVKSSEDAVIVFSLEGQITSWSHGAERLLGYSQRETVGRPVSMLSYPAAREETRALLARMLAGGRAERTNTELLTKEGRPLSVSFVTLPIHAPSGELLGIAEVVRDITGQTFAEDELDAYDELYRSVVDALQEGVFVQARSGEILAANESAVKMLGLGDGGLIRGRPLIRLIHEDGAPLREDEFPAVVSMRTGKPQAQVVVGAESVDGSMSWLLVNSRPLRHPHQAWPYAAVSSMTDVTSSRDAVRQLQAARVEDLARLAHAAECRDDDTHQHTERVARLAELIARELGTGAQAQATIRLAAPLHDIGKLGIPDQILLKPGGLTDAEQAVMKTHTTIGARVLGKSEYPVLVMAREIALTHHERWDGAGYPAGLRASAIPIAGRIVAAADVFDAITHARPYKEALPAQHAIAEITRASGTQFDAQVVEAFMACVGDVRG